MIALFAFALAALQPAPQQGEERVSKAEAPTAKPQIGVRFSPEVEASMALLKARRDAHRPEMELLINRAAAARGELEAELASETPDAERLREAAVRLHNIQGQVIERGAAHMVDAYLALTPEQQGHVLPFVRRLLLGNPAVPPPARPPHPAPQAPKPTP